jgi:hypothetical protein
VTFNVVTGKRARYQWIHKAAKNISIVILSKLDKASVIQLDKSDQAHQSSNKKNDTVVYQDQWYSTKTLRSNVLKHQLRFV